jgi:hypothetical protein
MSTAWVHKQLLPQQHDAHADDMTTSQLVETPWRTCCATSIGLSCWPADPTAHELPSAAAVELRLYLSSPAQHQQVAADAASTLLVSYQAPWALAAACPCRSTQHMLGNAHWPLHDDSTAYSKQSVQA